MCGQRFSAHLLLLILVGKNVLSTYLGFSGGAKVRLAAFVNLTFLLFL